MIGGINYRKLHIKIISQTETRKHMIFFNILNKRIEKNKNYFFEI
jgi:hypothetical protein